MDADQIVDELVSMNANDAAACLEVLRKTNGEFDIDAVPASLLASVGVVAIEILVAQTTIEDIKVALAGRIVKLQALDAML
jgi:hypothetical protein